ncbi:MAG: ankyrin repeat domain-containing protein [Akkermansia sp.]|nr:ankyrin repeat domain-containing protein [Akkermansia sp.]
MIHSNNTKSAVSLRLPRHAWMLLGIISLAACLAPAPAASQDGEAQDKPAATEKSTPAKPEMSLSDIEDQLIRYNCVSGAEAWKVIDHFKLAEDGLETVRDFPVIAEVLWMCHGRPAAVPRAKYVRSLIAMGADVNATGTNGNAPLFQAIVSQNVDCMQLLIDAGANVNAPGKLDMTPLMVACLLRNPEAVKVLLKAKAKINYKLKDGTTAMDILMNREVAIGAPEEDRLECIKLLKAEKERLKAKKAARKAAQAQPQ